MVEGDEAEEGREVARGDEREAQRNKGEGRPAGREAKTATSDSGKQQRSNAARGGSRAIVPSRLFISSTSSSLFFSLLSAPRRAARETLHTVGFIVFELDAPIFCFVSRAIRGANCRSYAIAFLFPPFATFSP